MTEGTGLPRAEIAYESTEDVAAGLTVVLGFVGLRMLGVYFLVVGVTNLSSTLIYFLLPQIRAQILTDWQQTLMYIAYSMSPVAAQAIVGFLLFSKAQPLAIRCFGRVRFAGGSISAYQTLALLIAAVGLFTLTTGLPNLFGMIANLISGRNLARYNSASSETWLLQGGWLAVLIVVSQPVIGIVLVLNAKRLAQIGMRRFGRDAGPFEPLAGRPRARD